MQCDGPNNRLVWFSVSSELNPPSSSIVERENADRLFIAAFSLSLSVSLSLSPPSEGKISLHFLRVDTGRQSSTSATQGVTNNRHKTTADEKTRLIILEHDHIGVEDDHQSILIVSVRRLCLAIFRLSR